MKKSKEVKEKEIDNKECDFILKQIKDDTTIKKVLDKEIIDDILELLS